MALSAGERADQIGRFLDYLRKQIVVERAILYGSSARAQTHAESDIDLAVLSPDLAGLGRFSRLRLLLRAAWKAGTDLIEPIGYTAEEFDASKPGTFADEIRKHGIVVYEAKAVRTELVAEPSAHYGADEEPS
jgi:predicted nucleotidyltransferase